MFSGHPSTAECERLTAEAALESNSHFQQLAANAQADLVELWQTTIRPLEIALISKAVEFVSARRDSAIEAEKSFFQSMGCPPERTSASKTHDALLAELQRQLDLLARPVCSVLKPDDSVLERVFGCPILI